MEATAPGPLAKTASAAAGYARAFTGIRFGAGSPEEAERARAKVLDALDYLEEELGEGEYLVGDSFTVADQRGALPQAARGAQRLQVGRRDVPPAPQAGRADRGGGDAMSAGPPNRSYVPPPGPSTAGSDKAARVRHSGE